MDPVVPISNFISETETEEIPSHVTAAAKRALIDTFGCILAGSSAPGVREIVVQIEEWGGAAQSAVAAFGTCAPAPFAALIFASPWPSLAAAICVHFSPLKVDEPSRPIRRNARL